MFSDRDISNNQAAVQSALATADALFGSLLFDYDSVEWLKAHIGHIPVVLVFESALELMSCTKLGSFTMNSSGGAGWLADHGGAGWLLLLLLGMMHHGCCCAGYHCASLLCCAAHGGAVNCAQVAVASCAAPGMLMVFVFCTGCCIVGLHMFFFSCTGHTACGAAPR